MLVWKQEIHGDKTVDELRAANNPKLVYKLDNHMGPALNPIQSAPTKTSLGKIVQET